MGLMFSGVVAKSGSFFMTGGKGDHRPGQSDHGHEEGAIMVFVATSTQRAGPTGRAGDSVWEVVDVDVGEFARVFPALEDIDSSGSSVRDVLQAIRKPYADDWEGRWYHGNDERWCEV